MVFTKLKAELTTLAQPVPVPGGLFCARSGPRRAGGLGQDYSVSPCPRFPVPDHCSKRVMSGPRRAEDSQDCHGAWVDSARDLSRQLRSGRCGLSFRARQISSLQLGVGTTAGRAGYYASPALPETPPD
jgi:hypothetical protein